jgi:Domain of unknown function (DUF1918)
MNRKQVADKERWPGAMYAQVGDRLIIGGDPGRAAVIIGVPHADGTPPYVVKWLATGHIAMVSPGQFGRVIRSATSQQESAQPSP